MEHCRSLPYQDRSAVSLLLEARYGLSLDRTALGNLVTAIMPFIARTRLPFEAAVAKIAENYRCYGEFVECLQSSPETSEWQDVLTWIVEFASNHTKFPKDTVAVSAPDLDAYDDIRQKIHTYNFEGTFQSWLTVAVISRINRYWRDQQTLRAGGKGIKSPDERQKEDESSRWQPAASDYLSLDRMIQRGSARANILASPADSTDVNVEAAELRTLIKHELTSLATTRNDPLLLPVWYASVEQELKLRETAESLGLTVSQVHRRVVEARKHLRQSPQISQWHDAFLQ